MNRSTTTRFALPDISDPAVIQAPDGLVHIVDTRHRRRIEQVVLHPAKLQAVPMPHGQ